MSVGTHPPPPMTRDAHRHPDHLYPGPLGGAPDTLKYQTWAMLHPIRIHCPDH